MKKSVSAVLQGVCAGLIAICILTVNFWTDGTFDISELGRPFEETAVFLRDTEDIIRRKIACTQNLALFQTNGVTDLNREVDIRQYAAGITEAANRNENTTYLISDLINYAPQAGALAEVIDQAASSFGTSSYDWDWLTGQTRQIEIILPVSGNALEETAKAATDPFGTLLRYYTSLVETSRDLQQRYRAYTREQELPEGSDNPQAPSNVRYYVENTTSKSVYTNLDVKGVASAREAIRTDSSLQFLFEGIRTMDIMVANAENSLSERVISNFIDVTFAGSNERVLIAVDPAYAVGDQLHESYLSYERREPVVIGAMVLGSALLLLLIVLLVWSIRMTGKREDGSLEELSGFDLVPTEAAVILLIALELFWLYACRRLLAQLIPPRFAPARYPVFLIVSYELLLYGILSAARRIRHDALWRGSLLYTVVRVSAQVLEARITSGRVLVFFVLFIGLHVFLLRRITPPGVFILAALDLAVLLYLLRDQVGKLSVQQGLRELSTGRLDYRIDTQSLTGDSLEMAEAVNEMGDGLQDAVDAMLRSERLKAELVTNVSHDLKTPLTSIISYIGLLQREELNNERAEQYLEVLERKSHRLESLISDLIEASRIQSGNVELHMDRIDLQQMLRMAEGEFEDRFTREDLHTELELEGPARIRADGSQLWRVLENLMGNIAKYAKPGSTVWIRLKKDDGRVEAVFENESREALRLSGEELQERFVRGDAARHTEGSGLGLSIASSLTQLMGGTFRAQTEGRTFRASLSFPEEVPAEAEES